MLRRISMNLLNIVGFINEQHQISEWQTKLQTEMGMKQKDIRMHTHAPQNKRCCRAS